MIKQVFGIVLFIVLLATILSAGAEEGELVLDGGRKGDVPFPHGLHQKTVESCNVCHAKFPQKNGTIKKRVGNGTLQKMEIMKDCMNCHKELSAEGKPAGPERSCAACHTDG